MPSLSNSRGRMASVKARCGKQLSSLRFPRPYRDCPETNGAPPPAEEGFGPSMELGRRKGLGLDKVGRLTLRTQPNRSRIGKATSWPVPSLPWQRPWIGLGRGGRGLGSELSSVCATPTTAAAHAFGDLGPDCRKLGRREEDLPSTLPRLFPSSPATVLASQVFSSCHIN